LLYFVGLGAAPLSNPDEGLYGELPREMLETSKFVTPQCNYAAYPDKPPLIPWLGAALYRVAGCTSFTARFWAAASGLAGVAAVYLLGRALFDPATGVLGALIYATSAGTVVFSRFMLLDQPIATLLSWTLLGAWQMTSAKGSRRRRGWACAVGAFAGLAVLTKGLQGVVLPGAVFVVTLAADRGFRARLRGSAVAWAFATFLLVALPWHLLAAVQDPESLRILLFNEQIDRFLDHREPLDYDTLPVPLFLGIFLAWGFPWSLSLGVIPGRGGFPAPGPLRGRRDVPSPSPARFVLVWLLVVLGFFAASQCRLPPYSLPALPALALLLAPGWRTQFTRASCPVGWRALLGPALLALTGAGFLGALRWSGDAVTEFTGSRDLTALAYAVSCAALVLGGVGGILARRRGGPWALASMALAALLFSITGALGLAIYQERESFSPVAAALRADRAAPEAVVVLEHPREYESIGGLCFFLGRRVLVLKQADRPSSPYPHGPSERFFVDEDEFWALWRSDAQVYFVGDPASAYPNSRFHRERCRLLCDLRGRRVMANAASREWPRPEAKGKSLPVGTFLVSPEESRGTIPLPSRTGPP
jgi:4-amino-4-deoxy-L-arabinose transferase-like glycosyltransferase